MQSKKCCESVIDITTKRTRKCKLYRHFHNYCYIHAQKVFKSSVTLIQKIWRGYYIRKKLKNLFFNLPLELQSHIMKFVRKDHYIEKKWIPSVLKIYKNRLFTYHVIKKNVFTLFNNTEIDVDDYASEMVLISNKEKATHEMIDFYTG